MTKIPTGDKTQRAECKNGGWESDGDRQRKNSHGLQGRKRQELKIWRQSQSERAEKRVPGRRKKYCSSVGSGGMEEGQGLTVALSTAWTI